MNDQRSASTSLAAILEQRRPLLKEHHLVKKDEGALNTVANEFEARHFRAGQVLDDDEVFLDWIFWGPWRLWT